MDFLTPELFNTLIIANLIVGVGLALLRFYQDMTRPLPAQQREQEQDGYSQSLEDTQPKKISK